MAVTAAADAGGAAVGGDDDAVLRWRVVAQLPYLYPCHCSEFYRFAVLDEDACGMIAVGFEGTRYAPQRSADVCVFLIPVATTDAGYLRFLLHNSKIGPSQ